MKKIIKALIIFLTATLICCQNNNKQKKTLPTTEQLSSSSTIIDHQKKKKKKKNKHHHNQNNKLKTINNNQEIINEKEELKINNNEIINDEHDQQNDENKIKTIIDKQEKVINDIKEEIDHLDVNNNAINNEQKRLQHCHDLINKINDYQNNQEVYQLLLPLQKTLIIKQKLIKHYYQSLIGKIIIILNNVFFIFIIMNLIYRMLYFFVFEQNNRFIHFIFVFTNKFDFENRIDFEFFPFVNNRNNYKFVVALFYYIVIFTYINYFLNMLFNNNNERLFNNIVNLFNRHADKRKINKYLFIDEKHVGFFRYDHSCYFIDNHQKYYYVPLLFDNLSNWFLTSCDLMRTCFFIIMIVFFHYFFMTKYKKLRTNTNINNILTTLNDYQTADDKKNFFNNHKIPFLSISKDHFSKNVLSDILTNFNTFNDNIAGKNVIKKFAYEYLSIIVLENDYDYSKITFFIITFLLTSISFDNIYLLFHNKNNKQMIVFYWQHCFNELIKNLFKSLPIIRNHYFMQPSLCKFWYPIVLLLLIHPLLFIIYLLLFGTLLYGKPLLFFRQKTIVNYVIGNFDDDNSIFKEAFNFFADKNMLLMINDYLQLNAEQ